MAELIVNTMRGVFYMSSVKRPNYLVKLTPNSTDVLDRWRAIFNENNPHIKFRKWKETISSKDIHNDFGP